MTKDGTRLESDRSAHSSTSKRHPSCEWKEVVYQKPNYFVIGKFSLQLPPESPVPAPSRQLPGPAAPLGQPHISSPSLQPQPGPRASLPSTPNLVAVLPVCLIIFFSPGLLANTVPAGLLVGPQAADDASSDTRREDLPAGLLLRQPCCRGTGHLKASTQDETCTKHPG